MRYFSENERAKLLNNFKLHRNRTIKQRQQFRSVIQGYINLNQFDDLQEKKSKTDNSFFINGTDILSTSYTDKAPRTVKTTKK